MLVYMSNGAWILSSVWNTSKHSVVKSLITKKLNHINSPILSSNFLINLLAIQNNRSENMNCEISPWRFCSFLSICLIWKLRSKQALGTEKDEKMWEMELTQCGALVENSSESFQRIHIWNQLQYCAMLMQKLEMVEQKPDAMALQALWLIKRCRSRRKKSQKCKGNGLKNDYTVKALLSPQGVI